MDKMSKMEKQIDALALAVQKGFEEVHEKIDRVHKELSARMDSMQEDMNRRFDEVERRFDQVDMRILGHTNRLEILEDKMRLVFTKIGLNEGSKGKFKNA